MKFTSANEMYRSDMFRIVESKGVPLERVAEALTAVTATPPEGGEPLWDVLDRRIEAWKRENL